MPMDTIINMKKQNEKRGQFLSAVEQPRILAYYPDALMAIADIYEIMEDYANAANAYGRIVELLEKEWGLTEETDSYISVANKEKARLLGKKQK